MKNNIQDNYLKKELYELIKTDESIFDFIQESSLDGLWYWDIEHPENEWMNPKFWTVLGYNPGEMPHKASAWQHIINKDDLKTATENFNKHCEDPNHPYDQIVRYTHKNGSTVWIHCRGLAIRDKNGKALRMLGAHHDITDAKQAEKILQEKNEEIAVQNEEITTQNEELNQANLQLFAAKEKAEESELKLRLMYENSSMGIASATLDLKITSANSAFCNLLGYSESELLGKTLQEYTHPETLEHNILMLKKLVEGKIPHFQLEKKFIHKDGHTIYGLLNATIIKNSDNEPLYFLGNVQDITDRKKAEEALKEANATKDQFISILGHDLRNPFSILLGFSGILIKKFDQYDREKIKEHLETINKTAEQTYNLLNNLQEWLRCQRNNIPFNPQTTNLYSLVYESYKLLIDSAEAKQISIDLDVAEEITAEVDSEMTKTVIRNLLSNAIKFTPESGKVCISASKNKKCVQVEISDNGTGMDRETLNSLFEIGKTESRPGTKGERGTGFGLLLCKEFVEKHGGQIWAESEIGKGSDFKFTLPLKLETSD